MYMYVLLLDTYVYIYICSRVSGSGLVTCMKRNTINKSLIHLLCINQLFIICFFRYIYIYIHTHYSFPWLRYQASSVRLEFELDH
jgi:hypothetical protein